MDAQQQFYEFIRRNPEEDAPRLIYADWLDELGDPRGEFIRVQCELAKLTEQEEGRRKLLQERERALWKLHRRQWMRSLKVYHVREARFRRGFLETAELFTRPHPVETPTQFAERWNNFIEQEPALAQVRLHLHHDCAVTKVIRRDRLEILGWPVVNGCGIWNCRIMIAALVPHVSDPYSRRRTER
jgi:uncharacterized protein (TIGR02996 family)